ncbi:MAG: hypothetical protein ACREK1_08340, partial [Longimicrobiales bacterium]
MPFALVLALALLTAAAGQPPSPCDALLCDTSLLYDALRHDTAQQHEPQQQERPLSISVDASNAYRPVIRVGPVLGDRELERAATSGLPLRVRVSVELWKDRLFDQLVDTTSWSTVVVHEPIGEQFFVRSLPATRGVRRAST